MLFIYTHRIFYFKFFSKMSMYYYHKGEKLHRTKGLCLEDKVTTQKQSAILTLINVSKLKSK